jgi:hypothetical protein
VSRAVSIASSTVSKGISLSRSMARSAAMSTFTRDPLRVSASSATSVSGAGLNSTSTAARFDVGVADLPQAPSTSR